VTTLVDHVTLGTLYWWNLWAIKFVIYLKVGPVGILQTAVIYKACPSESGTDKFMHRFI